MQPHTEIVEDPDRLLGSMVDRANGHHEAMRGMAPKTAWRYVKKVMTTNDVVFGVWQDSTEPHGVGIVLIKGERGLQAIVDEDKPRTMSQTAIPCVCAEQAIALKRVLGDDAEKLN